MSEEEAKPDDEAKGLREALNLKTAPTRETLLIDKRKKSKY